MSNLKERILFIVRAIGPWKIRPFYIGFLTFFMVASLYSLGQKTGSPVVPSDALLRPLFSFIIAMATLAQLSLFPKLLDRASKHLGIYLGVLIGQAFIVWSWVVLFRHLFPAVDSSTTAFLSPVPIVRFGFVFIVINGFLGLTFKKLNDANDEKERLLQVLETQQNQLLEHNEEVRSQTAIVLHDRVQSALVATCYEIQNLKSSADTSLHPQLDEIINQLEKIRSVDVREASRVLTPPFESLDLSAALQLLADQYKSAMKTTISVEVGDRLTHDESTREIALGIYRIAEQTLLNAIVHGKATEASIKLEVIESYFRLTITNNGLPYDAENQKGVGTAIISAWVRTLGGRWKIENELDRQVVLKARFPKRG